MPFDAKRGVTRHKKNENVICILTRIMLFDLTKTFLKKCAAGNLAWFKI
jgi:hypothetical protein